MTHAEQGRLAAEEQLAATARAWAATARWVARNADDASAALQTAKADRLDAIAAELAQAAQARRGGQ